MSTSKHFDKIVAVVLVLGLLLTVGFINGEALGIEKIVDEDAESYEATAYFTANDLKSTWDASQVTATIALNGDSATVSGNGAYYNDGSVVITGAGYYVVSGTLTDGNIVVDAYDSSKVFVILSGADITCSDDACLRVENAEKVFLLLAEGTENRMESGETYSQTALDDNTGGAIFAHDDLTINGSGSLTITGVYKHGIDANDDLVITGGAIRIEAPEDGVHVNDSFRFREANLTIDVGDDGIHSDTSVYIESGTLLISGCYEGIEALTIEVAGGNVMIYPEDDGFNANGGSGGMLGGWDGMGGPGGHGGRGGSGAADDSEGFAGRPDSEFGQFDGERPERPTEGEMPDFGPADGERPEMPENGELPDAEERNAPDGGDEEETWIRITGGNIMIINRTGRDTDGLDSNGSIYIEGGTVLVSVPGSGSNNAIDYGSENGGVAEISGGTIIACGASQMAESFDAASTQPSIFYNLSSAAEEGTAVTLQDADGSELLSWNVPCSFTSIILSSPDLTLGETYRLVIGGTAEEITLEEVSASYGETQSGGFGGGMNWGGHGGPGGGTGGPGRRAAGTETEEEDIP